MSVYDAMDYLGLLSNIPDKIRKERIASLLETGKFKRKYENENKGFIRRNETKTWDSTGILLHDPQILIVDEPTAGLDPEERIRFRNMLSEFAEDRIVILSTHISSDVETSCENIGVLDNGKMIWNGASRRIGKTSRSESVSYFGRKKARQDLSGKIHCFEYYCFWIRAHSKRRVIRDTARRKTYTSSPHFRRWVYVSIEPDGRRDKQ